MEGGSRYDGCFEASVGGHGGEMDVGSDVSERKCGILPEKESGSKDDWQDCVHYATSWWVELQVEQSLFGAARRTVLRMSTFLLPLLHL